ncbi:hypothetical protein KTT_45850 [Tengunoibacter tsumagoiensis]|uniref:Rieske domain-containing protein n=1 Tax=Tengunoibacter tsumagoiensis TaxID=2014871 RepID=A0A402A6S3_9CHLR|nr:hypothetical protein KTT_45850 [Tengunoibacter tsumagoiensis]
MKPLGAAIMNDGSYLLCVHRAKPFGTAIMNDGSYLLRVYRDEAVRYGHHE